MRWSKRNKYSNVKKTIDGVVFDSLLEAERYQLLKLAQLSKSISNLRIHTRWPLHANGELIGYYESDFDYIDEIDGRTTVEDCKGQRTPLYNWKAKHFNAQYTPIKIIEIYENRVRAA